MPDTGLLLLPTIPTILDETVAKKKPNNAIRTAPSGDTGISVLPVAIGLYLPLELSSTIMIGGVIRWFVDKKKADKEENKDANSGILFCSGMIAGEGLVGILLAILAVVNVSSVFDLSGSINLGNAGGVILMLLMILSLLKFSIWNKKKA